GRCSLVIWPPPTSAPFPSTPLFRSGGGDRGPRPPGAHALTAATGPQARARGRLRALGQVLLVAALALQVAGLYAPTVPGPDTGLDRKSTRLNSSHVKISDAVFCLKK